MEYFQDLIIQHSNWIDLMTRAREDIFCINVWKSVSHWLFIFERCSLIFQYLAPNLQIFNILSVAKCFCAHSVWICSSFCICCCFKRSFNGTIWAQNWCWQKLFQTAFLVREKNIYFARISFIFSNRRWKGKRVGETDKIAAVGGVRSEF